MPTTYYVSWAVGSDANNGLGPDASHATNKPWKTLAKALGASGIASGDQVYVAPGTQREVVTVAMTSATAETKITGDPANAQGFKDSGGTRVAAGQVIWSAYTTNDTTTPTASTLLSLAGRDFLTFEKLLLIGGNATPNCIGGDTSNSTNITFTDCTLLPGSTSGRLMNWTGLADISAHWLFDRCVFWCGTNGISFQGTAPTSGVADYTIDFVFRNCLFMGSGNIPIQFGTSGALANKPGGLSILNCSFFGNGSSTVTLFGANWSTTIPATFNNNLVYGAGGVTAGAAGQMTEDYNYFFCPSPRTNVSAGAHSVSGPIYALMLEIGQARQQGRLARTLGTPLAGSPLLGFGSTGGPPSVDLLNRPRPAGGASLAYAVGAFERHDTVISGGAANADGAAGDCWQLTGPGDQDLYIPVDAAATTVSIKQKTSGYVGTNYPQIELLAAPEIGVAGQTVADSAANASYTALTLAAFTPTGKGVVVLRLKNRTGDGAGIVWFDTLAVT
jgi:hypothetical protein